VNIEHQEGLRMICDDSFPYPFNANDKYQAQNDDLCWYLRSRLFICVKSCCCMKKILTLIKYATV